MEYLFAMGTVIVLFLCTLWGFREGLRMGMQSAKGVEPKPLKNPVTVVKEHKENRTAVQQAKQESEYWQNIESNDGYTDEERALINKGRVE